MLNPNGADWHIFLADTLGKAGMPEKSLAELKKALRLNPTLPDRYRFIAGRTYYQTAQYEKAINIFRSLVERDRIHPARNYFLVASYVASGRLEEAKFAVGEFLKINPTERNPRIWVHNRSNFKNQADKDRLLNDLAKAGLKWP